MTHADRMKEDLFTDFQFSARHLSPLRRLYRQMRRECLGTGFAFRASPGLHPNMTWHYASNAQTLAAFRRSLTGSRLRESLTVVHGASELLAACFVVVQGDTPACEYHVDYGESQIPMGLTGTMLTPLVALGHQFGHLGYRKGEEELEYRYKVGDAILFDGKFEHRSQESDSKGPATRVLVSWSIATSDPLYRVAIERIIESQTGVPNPGLFTD